MFDINIVIGKRHNLLKNYLIAALILFSMVPMGCKATYNKSTIAESVQKLIKKEYNLDGRAKLEGETLYLEVNLEGLVSTEQKILADMLKKVQGAALVITRVSLKRREHQVHGACGERADI